MAQNYLISSPIKPTWPKKLDNKLIFCSESAILSNDGDQNNYLKNSIINFRWKNKSLLISDIKYLDELFGKILKILSKKLNKLHNKNQSLRFWKILIGPWLSLFIHVYFERWQNIKTVFNKYKIDRCIFLNLDENLFRAFDNREFKNLVNSDIWNQYIYQSIIKNFLSKKNIIYSKTNLNNQQKYLENAKAVFTEDNKKKKISFKNLIFSSFNLFNRRNYEYFIYKTSLGFKNELELSNKLNQKPIFPIPDLKKSTSSNYQKSRNDIKFLFKPKNLFEKELHKMLINQIPSIFIENFNQLEHFSKNSNIPQNPKIIFTSEAIWFDTKISYHVGKLVDKKSKLIIGQHGGAFGLSKLHWPEKFEIDISDKFLSWGWNDKKEKKIKKFFILKNIKKKKLNQDKVLIMLKIRKRYFHSMESSSGTELYSDFIKNVSTFLFSLKNDIKTKTILRLPPNSNNFDNVDFYSNLENKFKFKNSDKINTAYNSSKIVIHPTNSTSFLETLTLNIPSLLILDKNDNPFRSNSKKYIDGLLKTKVLFFNHLEAAKFLNKIWGNDIDLWWNDKKTQNAISQFKNRYARKTDNINKKILKLLK